MKNIFYWSPCLSNIGTINSTLNSAIGLKKYFKEDYNVVIINVCGEWDKYRVYLKKNNIEIKIWDLITSNFYLKKDIFFQGFHIL